jgi:flotillin
VKPLEKIGDVRIVDLGGRGPLAGGATNGAAVNGGGSATDNLLGALLQYRANAPIIDQLLAQAGFTGSNPVEALISAVKTPTTTAVQPVAAPKGAGGGE